jgi:nucleoside-diphosphate-sugar epimerase
VEGKKQSRNKAGHGDKNNNNNENGNAKNENQRIKISKIKSGIFEVTGSSETRSFCYVEDGIAATIYCANKVTCEVVNIGNDAEITISQATNIIAEALGHHDINWTCLPGKPGSTTTRRPNIAKLRLIMPNYQPRNFAEGMKKIVASQQPK